MNHKHKEEEMVGVGWTGSLNHGVRTTTAACLVHCRTWVWRGSSSLDHCRGSRLVHWAMEWRRAAWRNGLWSGSAIPMGVKPGMMPGTPGEEVCVMADCSDAGTW